MLLAGQPYVSGRHFTESQKTPDMMPELQKELVVSAVFRASDLTSLPGLTAACLHPSPAVGCIPQPNSV
jgi:hypothetical protein